MNLDPRQTVLIQTPVGKGLPPWQEERNASGASNLQQWLPAMPQALRGTSPLGDTQVAPAAKRQETKLSDANNLQELSAESKAALNLAKWRDKPIVPAPPPSNVGKIAIGISGGIAAGVVACVWALTHVRESTSEGSPQHISLVREVKQAVKSTDVEIADIAQEKWDGEAHTDIANLPAEEVRSELPSDSTTAVRLKMRLSPEVLYRLELSLEQAERIRRILVRHRKDLPVAESQIRELLTEDQDRHWQKIVP